MHHLTPHFIIEQFKQGHVQGSFPAVGLFIDISGFTQVTESLMQHQQHGVEELAKVMRAIFFPVADSIFGHGGFICTCAGDAITALFPLDDHNATKPYHHALAAAYAIQQEMMSNPRQRTRFGTFTFAAKIGLADGCVEWGVLSNPTVQQNAYYFRGSTIECCVQAEAQAAGNDIILSNEACQKLAAVIDVEPVKNGEFVKLRSLRTTALPEAKPIRLPLVTMEQATDFSPPELIQQTAPGEFRHALNVFINLTDIETHAQLADLMQVVFRLQQQYGGYLNRIDFGDKGCHLLLFWGAPIAYETDVERSLSFLLDLQAAIQTPMRAGVTYRISHAGFIGSDLREEYTCYGRGINLAVRQMSEAAWGEIWLDEEMARLAGSAFVVEYIDRLPFKGFAEPMAVFRLDGRQETANLSNDEADTQLVGREAELAALRSAIEPIFAGRSGGVITIHGEAGIGKSRLMYELRRRLTGAVTNNEDQPALSRIAPPELRKTVNWFHCPADEILRQPLSPFRYWLRHYFRQSNNSSDSQNRSRFKEALDGLIGQLTDPVLKNELAQRFSYLGALVDLHWPGSRYEQSDPKLRFENTLQAIKNLIKAESLRQPVVVEMEDAHWLDPQSVEMVAVLTRNIEHYPIAVVCAARYNDDGTELRLPLDEEIPRRTIELAHLTLDDGKKFSEMVLEGQISEQFGQFLIEKSHGNPFFIKQLALDLKERGALTQRDQPGQTRYYLNPLHAGDVPTSIRAVLISRLDRLPQPVKAVVQVASVLGAEFEVQVLAEMLRAKQNLKQNLEQAEAEQIWTKLAEDRYHFKHALLRDSAYSMQVGSRLRALHRRGAEALETLYAADLSRHYTALAYHYEQAEIIDKSIIYLEQAGDQAKANYQNEEALKFYDRLLGYPIDRYKEMVIYRKQGEILNLLSLWDLALEKLHQGLDKLDGPANTQQEARLRVIFGDVLLTKGRYDQALSHLTQARNICEALGDKQTLFTCFITMARNYMYKLEPDRALAFNQKALQLAEEIADEHGAAMAMAGIGAVYAMRDEPELALPNLLKSIPKFKRLGDKREMIHPMFNAGLVYHFIGDYEQALAYFQQVFNEATEIGDRVGVFLSLHYTGHTYLSAGQYEKAVPYLLEALQKRSVTGGDGLLSQTEPYLANAYANLGQDVEALETALRHFENVAQVGRDTESGRAHVVVGLVLGRLQADNNRLQRIMEGQINDAEAERLKKGIERITQQTKIPPKSEAYFTYAVDAATTSSRPYLLTLVPALYYFGQFLCQAGEYQAGQQKLAEAKKLASQHGMVGKLEQIKRVYIELEPIFGETA